MRTFWYISATCFKEREQRSELWKEYQSSYYVAWSVEVKFVIIRMLSNFQFLANFLQVSRFLEALIYSCQLVCGWCNSSPWREVPPICHGTFGTRRLWVIWCIQKCKLTKKKCSAASTVQSNRGWEREWKEESCTSRLEEVEKVVEKGGESSRVWD